MQAHSSGLAEDGEGRGEREGRGGGGVARWRPIGKSALGIARVTGVDTHPRADWVRRRTYIPGRRCSRSTLYTTIRIQYDDTRRGVS